MFESLFNHMYNICNEILMFSRKLYVNICILNKMALLIIFDDCFMWFNLFS